MKHLGSLFEKAVTFLAQVCGWLGMLVLLAMMVLVTADVVMRFAVSRVISGATEIVQVLFLCLMLAVPLVILRNGNTMVEVFLTKFPRPAQRIINAITVFATAVFCALMGWQMLVSARYSFQYNVTYTLSRIPEGAIYTVFGFSCLVMALSCLVVIGREWGESGPMREIPVNNEDGERSI